MPLADTMGNSRNLRMEFRKEDLEKFWSLVKDKPSIFIGDYIGLKEVSFNLDLEYFKKLHLQNHRESTPVIEALVILDIKKAIEIVSKADVRCHHLSCAADVGLNDNAAFCVHYRKNGLIYALAVPGVNYIPSEETFEKLKKYFK